MRERASQTLALIPVAKQHLIVFILHHCLPVPFTFLLHHIMSKLEMLNNLRECRSHKRLRAMTKEIPELLISERKGHFDLWYGSTLLSRNISWHKDYHEIRMSVYTQARRALA